MTDDSTAIRAVRNGDTDAYRHFLRRYRGVVASVAARYLDRNLVEEAAQETFIRAYSSLHSYDETKPFKSWITTIAIRCCYEFLRKKYMNRETSFSDLPVNGADVLERLGAMERTDFSGNGALRYEAMELLEWGLAQIPPVDRMVLQLTYLEGYSTAETAKMLGLSRVNVGVRSHRSRKKLRGLYEKMLEGSDG